MKDVLQAVKDGFVIFDFSAFAGIRPLLAALEVGVHFTRVGGILFVMSHLSTHKYNLLRFTEDWPAKHHQEENKRQRKKKTGRHLVNSNHTLPSLSC